MKHQSNFQVSTENGKELQKGWALKTREKGGRLPEPVSLEFIRY